MLFLTISFAAITVIGVAKSLKTVMTDGYGPVPTRTH